MGKKNACVNAHHIIDQSMSVLVDTNLFPRRFGSLYGRSYEKDTINSGKWHEFGQVTKPPDAF